MFRRHANTVTQQRNELDRRNVAYSFITTVLPTTRKTLNRVASSRRVEEKRETGIKSTAIFGKPSALRYARNSFSTEVQNEMRLSPSAPNEIQPFPSPPKCSGIARFHNDRHRHIWCQRFFSWRWDSTRVSQKVSCTASENKTGSKFYKKRHMYIKVPYKIYFST
ncbi:hypothetical protein AVEN_127132-1 [Araneus ventricosus]|uniref:Uncharacterized protein n=1 Tax=Araneus ventricosus TaxID=182803 RepID=A0A4Y2TI38_ARAVE|nr:hypothetical protein AVEN_127132-1 [Araneus ventricosus]